MFIVFGNLLKWLFPFRPIPIKTRIVILPVQPFCYVHRHVQ